MYELWITCVNHNKDMTREYKMEQCALNKVNSGSYNANKSAFNSDTVTGQTSITNTIIIRSST